MAKKKTKPRPSPGRASLPEEQEALLSPPPGDEPPSWWSRAFRWLIGKPRDLSDRSLFHQLSLVPFLAWVGLGADGLSSSCYGPEEAFRTVGEHTYLAVLLAAAVAGTIFIISAAYSQIIEQFPHGGGGYLVATHLLSRRMGVLSGCALLVDYVLTITVSIAAAGDAVFSFLPLTWQAYFKLPLEFLLIVILVLLNIRGVKESVLVLLPIFLVFLATHLFLVLGSFAVHAPEVATTVRQVGGGFAAGWRTLGGLGMLALFLRAYSMGGGTYTGLEAVSNGLLIMREPRVQTGQRTMLYMAASLAFMASGLLFCYLLVGVGHVEGKTLNAVLADGLMGGWPGGAALVVVTLFSEGALLVVAAQAGFFGGPRVLANMAVDSWVPRRFSDLSDRLTAQNGILLMGAASLAALLYTRGNVRHLVVMYSINVFLTFSLSMFGMLRHWLARRHDAPHWRRRVSLFASGFLLCSTVLVITTVEKFGEGGWVTLAVTCGFLALCFLIQRHYANVSRYMKKFDETFRNLPLPPEPTDLRSWNPKGPTACVLVGGYGGAGIHMVLNVLRGFPNYFQNMLFVSVGVIDSGKFKGHDEIDALREATERSLGRYVELARRLGLPAQSRFALGTNVVEETEKLCRDAARDFSHTTFFSGQAVFRRETWYHRFLHNQTSFNIQKRLHLAGLTVVVMPMRVQ